jgi:uncharacterized protein (TIGR03435 family)
MIVPVMYPRGTSSVLPQSKPAGGWIMPVFCRLVIFLLVALPAVAQSQAFEVITIKPHGSGDPRNARMQVLLNGDLITSAVPVVTLLSYAYDVPTNPSPLLSGLPDWAIHERYDIEAKVPSDVVPPGLPESELRGRTRQMIRGLLADRFKLVMRVEQKTMRVYALSVASGGANLQKSTLTAKDCAFDTDREGCHSFIGGLGHPLHANAIDMDDLAHYIGNWTDLPVVNRTALSGLFAVSTEGWTAMRLPPPPPNAAPSAQPSGDRDMPAPAFPTIFVVLGKLGLELKQQEATLPVYTVERIERPAAN